MKISPILMALVSMGDSSNWGPADSVGKLVDEKRRHPQNRLYQLNKLLNQYTIMLKGFPVVEDMDATLATETAQRRNLRRALVRNNAWLQNMLETFYRTTASGDNVSCSKYFHQQTRKRRSTTVYDLKDDAWIYETRCILIDNDHKDGVVAGEEEGECTDCCAKDADKNSGFEWIPKPEWLKVRGKLVSQPSDMAKAMRRVMGAAKKWGQRWIKDCGGQQGILNGDRTPHYSMMVKRLRSGMKHDLGLEDKVKVLKWKRVFPVSTVNEETGKKVHHKHDQFWADLGIDA